MGWVEIFPGVRRRAAGYRGISSGSGCCSGCNRPVACPLEVEPYLDNTRTRSIRHPEPLAAQPDGDQLRAAYRADGLRLDIADVDILDGTPLLDIKPYVPGFRYISK